MKVLDLGLWKTSRAVVYLRKRVQNRILEFHIWGKCPSCGDLTEDVFPLFFVTDVADGTPGPGQSPGPQSDEALLDRKPTRRNPKKAEEQKTIGVQHCRCVENHGVSPASSPTSVVSTSGFGCGASWLIGATFGLSQGHTEADLSKAPSFFVPDRLDEAEYWQNAEAIATDAANALSSVQGTAKGWQTALGLIIALVSLTGIIGGRTGLDEINSAARASTVWLVAFALAVDAVALYLSTLSSLGFPSLKRITKPTRVHNADLGPLQQAAQAALKLKASAILTGISFLAALTALLIFLIAPSSSTVTSGNRITVAGVKGSVCGTVTINSGDPRTVTVTPLSGTSHTYQYWHLVEVGAPCTQP
jgi:hypothetical protein